MLQSKSMVSIRKKGNFAFKPDQAEEEISKSRKQLRRQMKTADPERYLQFLGFLVMMKFVKVSTN